MNYLEFLSEITDETLKKKKSYYVSSEKWRIGDVDGGIHGSVDKYLDRFVNLLPNKQKPSESPRFCFYIFLKKEDRKIQNGKPLVS